MGCLTESIANFVYLLTLKSLRVYLLTVAIDSDRVR